MDNNRRRFKHLKNLFNANLFAIFTLAACAQDTEFDAMLSRLLKGDVPFVTSEELNANQDQVIILDAREPNEFAVSHITGALQIGYDDFDLENVAGLDRNEPIVVYCSVGYRSEKIARKLIKAGFTDVRNLYGGIFQWSNQALPLVNESGATDTIHTYNKKWSKWVNTENKVYE